MRRVILFVLLALALPTAALASSFTFDTGTTVSGFVGGTSLSPIYSVSGSGLTFTINLTDVNCVRQPCTFSGGSLTVTNASHHVVLSDSLLSGTFMRGFSPTVISDDLSGIQLTPHTGGGQVAMGTIDIGMVTWDLSNGAVHSDGQVLLTGAFNAPEPSVLEGLWVGFGMFGFAGMTSRKLKLGM